MTSKGYRELILVGYGGRVIAGPIVHFAHRRIGPGFASLALEALSPIAGGLLGFLYMVAKCDGQNHDPCHYDTDFAVRASGAVAAVTGTILDAALLANEPVKPEPPKDKGVSFAPYIAPQVFPGGRKGQLGLAWTFGLAGRF